ncbi:MAG: alpha-mannosidase [Clostridiales bacterium]|nr:alpha-mannosidase [Clostridiales bacterium]
MEFIYEKTGKLLNELKDRMYGEPIELTGLEYCECGYKTSNVLPRGLRWTPVPEKFGIGGGQEQHFWVRGKIVIPDALVGKSVSLISTSFCDNGFNKSPQILVYIDGNMTAAFDQYHLSIDIDSSTAEHDFIAYCYINADTSIHRLSFSIRETHEDVKKLYYDVMIPYDILDFTNKNDRAYVKMLGALDDALNLVDFSLKGEDFNACARAASASLEENLYSKYSGSDTACVCIGHTHIDVAWLWTFAQTREKAQRTFATVVTLMKKYPEYKFMSSQAQLYKFVKEDAPELYAEIIELVKQGRWEVEGAMWVESDCNLPSGESLIRQILYGKRFFKDEFGVDCKVLWLPDCFGFNAALPQILKKTGVEYFVTSKLSWNETNTMPYDFFKWKGIDGSSVMAYFLTAKAKQKDGVISRFTTYNAKLNASIVAGTYDRFRQKDISDEALITYGYGDGGGGPTEEMLEQGLRLTRGLPGCPKTKFEFAGQFLSEINEKAKAAKSIPEWNGELYLELHRGTYTSQAKNKKNNRKSEYIYKNAEFYSVLGELLCGAKYPYQALSAGWEKILLCQFHDVIPGSSIRPVYDDTDKIYEKLMGDGQGIVDTVRNALSQKVKTYGGLLVFNPNSFETSAEVMAEGEWRYVEKIPALGWAVVPPAEKIMPVVSEKKIENDFLAVEFDDNMDICRIYDKTARREVLKAGEKVRLEAYEDIPKQWDAWEITEYYKEKRFDVNNIVSVTRYECGEKAGFTVVKKFRDSLIKQTITLDGHTRNIGFDNDIDWNNEHILLKAAFPLDINTTSATYDIQFGNVQRPTHSNTSWDAAKFEVCAHKYADMSENGYGVSLINDCKYGYSAEGSTLSLTLLKSATYPDKTADKCNHKFTYVLYPHADDFTKSGTVENAYIINNPLYCTPISRQDGILPDRMSFAKIDGNGTFIDTIKKAENGDGYIVRIYDAVNSRGPRTLTFGVPVKEAYVCDMLENELESAKVEGRNISVNIKPFEIITLKVKI